VRVAVIGSRSLCVPDLAAYLPADTTVIISGGAKGIDMSAREFAMDHGIELIEFYPKYVKYGRAAPLYRNMQIIESADCVYAFWDGKSRGTAFTVQKCKESGKPCQVHMMKNNPGEA